MSTRVFEFTIEVFWVDDKKYGNDLIETTFSITFVSLLMYP
jgi:hypothetical protein